MTFTLGFKTFLATLVLASPLAAQDRMTQAQCTQALDALSSISDIEMNLPVAQLDDDGWCFLEGAMFAIGPQQHIRLKTVRWRATDIERFIDDGLPPRAFEIVGDEFGMITQTSDTVLDYLLALQSVIPQSGFGLRLRWDGVQNAVLVEEAYVDFSPNNRIEASARIEDVNLTDVASIQTSSGTAGLRDLLVESQFEGWFETYVAMVVGNMLLEAGDVTPQAQVEDLKRQAIKVVGEFPDVFMPEQSRLALSAFLMALPSPRGTAQLQISAEPTIGAARAILLAALPNTPNTTQVIETGLDGVTALFTWTPSGDTQ